MTTTGFRMGLVIGAIIVSSSVFFPSAEAQNDKALGPFVKSFRNQAIPFHKCVQAMFFHSYFLLELDRAQYDSHLEASLGLLTPSSKNAYFDSMMEAVNLSRSPTQLDQYVRDGDVLGYESAQEELIVARIRKLGKIYRNLLREIEEDGSSTSHLEDYAQSLRQQIIISTTEKESLPSSIRLKDHFFSDPEELAGQ